MNRLAAYFLMFLLPGALFLAPQPALGVDSLTGLTGMTDSPYYRYEVRGQGTISLRLTQSLWAGGAIQARIDMEKARLANARQLYFDAAASIAYDALAAHVEILCQNRLVDLAARNVDDYRDTIKMLQSRLSNGLATEGDIHLVESRLFRAEGVLAEYRAALLAAKANFQKATGKPVPASLAPVPLPKKMYRTPAEAVGACKAKNPKILAQQGTITASQEEEKVARAAFFPKFSLQAGPTWNFQDTPQDSKMHGVEALVVAQWNLYEGGAASAAHARTAAQSRQARQDMLNIADALEAEIMSTWAQYAAAADRIGHYQKSMAASSKAREIFFEQYMLGYKGLLDMLDADNEYFISACQHEIARSERVLGAYRLLTLGGEILTALGVSLPEFSETSPKSPKKKRN